MVVVGNSSPLELLRVHTSVPIMTHFQVKFQCGDFNSTQVPLDFPIPVKLHSVGLAFAEVMCNSDVNQQRSGSLKPLLSSII